MNKSILFLGYLMQIDHLGDVRIVDPSGTQWAEVAANTATAKRWIRHDIAARGYSER